MQFPPVPTCHENLPSVVAPPTVKAEWKLRGVGRYCTFCGSIHPEDFLKLLAMEKSELELADEKYSWPHKFYLEGVPEHPKFYSEHILDRGFDDEARAALLAVLKDRGGIEFLVDGKGLKYKRIGLCEAHKRLYDANNKPSP